MNVLNKVGLTFRHVRHASGAYKSLVYLLVVFILVQFVLNIQLYTSYSRSPNIRTDGNHTSSSHGNKPNIISYYLGRLLGSIFGHPWCEENTGNQLILVSN